MENFLKELCIRARETVEGAAQATFVMCIYKEYDGRFFLAVGYKFNGQSYHGIFELHQPPVDPRRHAIVVAIAIYLGHNPMDVVNDEAALQQVLTTAKEYDPVSVQDEVYTLDFVTQVLQNIKVWFPCYCMVDIDEDGGGD